MKTIETKPGVTLGFKESDRHRSVTEFILDNNCLIKNKDIIGRLSEITEEQAKELVSLGVMGIEAEGKVYNADMNEWYDMKEFMGDRLGDLYKQKLIQTAESLGIKESEFENYLVIKL
jgi:hypothetical protein